MAPYVLMIALGIHSVFEGLAVGIRPEAEKIESLIFGIVLHKGAEAMSLGICMTKNLKGQNQLINRLMLMFAAFTPLGVILGWSLQSLGGIWDIVFSSMAAGTFIYIACSEIIAEEFERSEHKIPKLFAFLLGIGFILMLFFIEPDMCDDDKPAK